MSEKTPKAAENKASVTSLSTQWSQLATAKAEIVQPLVDLQPIPIEILSEACRKAAELLGKLHIPPGTIYRWRNEFQIGGISALEHKPHRDRSESTLHPDLRQYIEDLLKTTNYKLAKVHRDAIEKAKKMELDAAKYPTYEQVRFIDDKLSDAAKKYGAKGVRAYRKTNELTGRFEADYPNDIWQCDHHLLDILVINEETGNPERPWITAVIDDYSRAIVGYYLSFDNPNSNAIALALHHAMCHKPEALWIMHGVPRLLYIDNGKDFRSRHIEEVCLHFQIERRSHEPYLARSKGKIERWFRTLEEMLIAYLDGYVGSNPQKRPAKVTPKLTLDQLRLQIVDFMLNTYHERIHSQTKAKPRARWSEHPAIIKQVDELKDLDYLLESKTSTIQNDGIQFKSAKYVDKDGKLTAYIGRTVRIFFNRNDVSTIRVYCRDAEKERFLCIADRNLAAQQITEQNKVIRRELRNEAEASKRRLKADNSNKTKTPNATPQQQEARPIKNKPSTSISIPPSPIIRYRYELDEMDGDTDGVE